MDEAENKWEHMKSDDFQNSGGLYEEILEKSRPNDHLFFFGCEKVHHAERTAGGRREIRLESAYSDQSGRYSLWEEISRATKWGRRRQDYIGHRINFVKPLKVT